MSDREHEREKAAYEYEDAARALDEDAARALEASALPPVLRAPPEPGRPLLDTVVVLRDAPAAFERGFEIPASAQRARLTAHVIAVGPGHLLQDGRYADPRVRAGDHVLLREDVVSQRYLAGGLTYELLPLAGVLMVLPPSAKRPITPDDLVDEAEAAPDEADADVEAALARAGAF